MLSLASAEAQMNLRQIGMRDTRKNKREIVSEIVVPLCCPRGLIVAC